jgi:hypothetical protein
MLEALRQEAGTENSGRAARLSGSLVTVKDGKEEVREILEILIRHGSPEASDYSKASFSILFSLH